MPKHKKEPSLLRDAVEIIAMLAVALLVIWGLFALISAVFDQTRETVAAKHILAPDAPCEGVGRVPEARRYLGGGDAVDVPTLEIVCETDPVLPEWWDPDAADIVWEADHSADVGKMVDGDKNVPCRDGGCPDWNLNTSLVGWDGRFAEDWELELFARVFMREFWGTSEACCEAGCDAILNLWASGMYGDTLGECLSAKNDFGKCVYSVYPTIWEGYYDPDGLEWCREFVRGRFLDGPEWTDVMYFQLYSYHDLSWTIPLFECDGVYFSKGK